MIVHDSEPLKAEARVAWLEKAIRHFMGRLSDDIASGEEALTFDPKDTIPTARALEFDREALNYFKEALAHPPQEDRSGQS